MASLKFIMDVDDDEPDAPSNKKDKDPAAVPSSSRQDPSSSQAYSSHVTSSSQAIERSLRPGTRHTTSSNTAAKPAVASASSPRSSARRRSTTSTDSMDLAAGYGSAASSSSRGGPANPSISPMRPVPNPAGADIPVKLTPITGRVSRARKGVPVHTCDICKPPKTFTRAEHLRRHQLSHQSPGYLCSYPGCGRVFHRPDLLTRHLQRHEQEGDKAAKSGDEDGGGGLSLVESLPNLGLQPQAAGPSSVMQQGPGRSSASGTAAAEMPSTNAPGFQQLRSTGDPRNPSLSPRQGGTAEHYSYNYPPRGSHDYQYSSSPSVSVINPTPTLEASPYSSLAEPYQQSRSTPSIFVVTQGLSPPSLNLPENGPPDLGYPDASPWPSSASDSTYSTPASDISRNHRYWLPRHQSPTADWPSTQLLSPYPNTVRRETQSPGPSLETIAGPAPPAFMSSFSAPSHFSTAPQNETFGAVLDVPLSVFGSTTEPASHTMVSPSTNTLRPHSRHHSVTSIHGATSPHIAPAHATETLVTPMRALPDRINSMASLGRQKEMVIDIADAQAQQAFMGSGGGFDMLGDLEEALGNGGQGRLGCETGVMALNLGPMIAGGGIPGAGDPGLLPRAVRAAIPGYIKVYWRRLHRSWPIVHRCSFEVAGEDALRCAVAAVATQYLDSKQDRINGNQLHEYAWQEAKRIPQWNLQVMQAILLCELFARFRGRKAVTRPSKQFESLYSRVLYHNPSMFDPAVMSLEQHGSVGDRWQAWLDAEARRRLLTACFIVDTHTSVYQQQRKAHEYDLSGTGATPPIPLIDRGAALWEASSAEEWAGLLSRDPGARNPTFIPPANSLTPEGLLDRPEFDRAAILALESLRLPRRPSGTDAGPAPSPGPAPIHFPLLGDDAVEDFDMDLENHPSASAPAPRRSPHASPPPGTSAPEERLARLFAPCPRANTYLALHHTPLHDLLAVSGDTWIFSQKVLPATSFAEHQKRLKAWAEHQQRAARSSPLPAAAAARATMYAARAILGFLATRCPADDDDDDEEEGEEEEEEDGDDAPAWFPDLGDYWALYVCALVCWAFGHRARSAGVSDRAGGADDEGTLAWLRLVAGARWPEEVAAVRGRREAGGVVGLVRRRLERDCVGGRSRLYVDAVGVLKKLEEGVNWKWF